MSKVEGARDMEQFIKIWNARPRRHYPHLQMNDAQLVAMIAEHERVHRGIDWLKAAEQGETAIYAARATMLSYIRKQADALTPADRATAISMGILNSDGNIPMVEYVLSGDPTPLPVPASAQAYPCWFWNESTAAGYVAATGNTIQSAITQLVATFQVMENDSQEGIVETMLNAGIWAFGAVGIQAVFAIVRTLAALTQATEAFAVFEGVLTIGMAVIRLFIAVFVLAILVPIVILLQKDASAIMVLINNTASDLVLQDLVVESGQVVGIFENSPSAPGQPPQAIIPAVFPMFNPATGQTINTVAAGFFMAQKLQVSFVGTVGAFQFSTTTDFPNGVNIGWSIPLALGSNSVLVDAVNTGNLAAFADSTEVQALQTSSSTASTGASVTANVNSGSGSEGYMILNFAPAANTGNLIHSV